jgi:16S rRNA (cytosine967-C5)-methyltransferase
VLDFCAGSGGKSLAFATKMNNKGAIYLHDVRAASLFAAQHRMKRAGVRIWQNIQAGETLKLEKLRGKMDWILVDAPCTGSGTLVRIST